MLFHKIDITEGLYEQAKLILFGGSTIVAVQNGQEIRKLKEAINKEGADKFPAICLKQMPRGHLAIKDGYHRIMAFYESGIKSHKAIIIKGEGDNLKA